MQRTTCFCPQCDEPVNAGGVFCETDDHHWNRDDYQAYKNYREDGYSHYQASVMAGFIDAER